MLKKLSVVNYILIDSLEIDFGKGLSIITGETGAGKSILLGALGLLSGMRADSDTLQDKKKKCIIEGVFSVSGYNLRSFFEENGLDYETDCIVRREVSPEGKSRTFINDTPVNLSVLKSLSASLIDIHSQHETLLLSNSRFQMNVLDAVADNRLLLAQYHEAYSSYHELRSKLHALIEEEAKSKTELDYLTFQLEEFDALRLRPGEQEELEQEQEMLQNADDIRFQLASILQNVSDSEENIIARLGQVQNGLLSLSRFDKRFSEDAERLKSILIELKDIRDNLEDAAAKTQADPSRLESLNERLAAIYALQKKHRVDTLAGLISFAESIRTRIGHIGSLEDEINSTRRAMEEGGRKLESAGHALTKSRQKVIPGLEKEIISMLKDLAMPHAVIRIALHPYPDDEFGTDGFERIQFLFSANKGGEFRELSKVASGGEMSRLMLCIKSILAKRSAMPTVIFDEIDTGISGETAARVGAIMKQMAVEHQVIAITHLPQIASKGDFHYQVYKELINGLTRSNLRQLKGEERVNEIARMLSGEKLTEAALDNARVLLSH